MRVIVAGALANKVRNGGEAWVRLSWIRGLRETGADVWFVERIAGDVCTDAAGRPAAFEDSVHRHWFDVVTRAFDLTGRAALILDDGPVVHGATMEQLADVAADADLLVNISGHMTIPALLAGPAVRAYVDIDPGFTQFWLADPRSGFRVPPHDVWFTIGENIGTPDCRIPGAGIEWIGVRQPVVLSDWMADVPRPDAPFTTVASWRGAFGPLDFGGHRYGVKVHEFRKVIDLPRHTRERMSIALDIHPADSPDRERLLEAGWELVDPAAVAADPSAFRDFVHESRAEFSVAQGIYVDTRSGWFSDRTTRYLAAGRPAIVQDTGFDRHIPAGDGLLAFGSPDDALAAIERVARDLTHHSRAARQIAEEYFDSNRVLARFLDIASARRGRRPAPRVGADEPPAPADAPAAAPTPTAPPSHGKPLRVLVSGMMSGVPGQGGAAWAVLQYVLGLIRLGHDVRFIEPIEADAIASSGPADRCGAENGAGNGAAASARDRHPLAASASAAYLDDIARTFALDGRIGLIRRGSDETYGFDYAAIHEFAARADVLLNLSGLLREPALSESIPVRVYVDLDPAFTQMWQAVQGVDMGFAGHTHFVTVGLSIGSPGCRVPTCGIEWIPTVQPVVLEQWPVAPQLERTALTGIANWRGYGSIDAGGVLYGQKAHSLRELIELPARSPLPLEFALAIHPDEKRDLAALAAHGWRLVDPAEAAATPARYHSFIGGSWAEFGVAKSGYVHSRCGWFSDRSLCYLASGRPVIAQETGFSRHLPVGEGILPFEDVDGAAAAIEAVRADYDRHSRAARRAAELVFESDAVLSRLLEQVDA